MKKFSIRSRMGINIYYYATTLTFKEIEKYIKTEIDETSLEFTDTIKSTKKSKEASSYLLNEDERLLSGLVVAICEGGASWVPIELNDESLESNKVGILEFSGEEKMFALWNKDRVEGIKMALKDGKNDLSEEEIQVMFIGYEDEPEDYERIMKIQSGLNKY